jgi:chitin synthase
MDSFTSGTSANNSIYMPRRVESFMDPEDARVYHKTQQQQKPAGGAYFEEARQGGPYEVSGQGSGKSPYAESVNSLSDDSIYQQKTPQRPTQSRHNSDHHRGRNEQATNSPLSAEYGNSGLEAPKAAYGSDSRSASRSGRSPLARQSYIRTAPGEGVEMELQAPQGNSLMRDASPAPLGEPQIYSHSRSESTDSKKRKRLSKAPPRK